MTPIILIAGNFVRENRWPMISLLGYVLLFGGLTASGGRANSDDVMFFLRSVGVYGVAFTALIAASGIHNERRSRRLLTVLSKGIERWQYLCGLLLGAMFDAAIYCVAIGLIGSLSLAPGATGAVWELVAMLMAAFLLAGTVALFFSTFVHPLMAALGTAITLGVMAALGKVLGDILPSYALAQAMFQFGIEEWSVPWGASAWAAVWAALFATMAAVVFSRRDIAVAVE